MLMLMVGIMIVFVVVMNACLCIAGKKARELGADLLRVYGRCSGYDDCRFVVQTECKHESLGKR